MASKWTEVASKIKNADLSRIIGDVKYIVCHTNRPASGHFLPKVVREKSVQIITKWETYRIFITSWKRLHLKISQMGNEDDDCRKSW